ncbi:MAG: hypothetical protein IAE78_02000 [Myxococcus sp.]|nr:hypothetical protein [Myxococcus sp.]
MLHALLASVAVVSALPMPGDAETARFNDAFERAEGLYSRGEYGAAIALFREADRLKVTPEVVYDLARSYEKLGDLEFTTLYDRLYLARAPDASDARDIASRVERTLARAEDDGHSLLEVFAPGAASLTVAGRHYPAPPLALFLAPGAYVVEGVFPSGTRRLSVQVKLGQVTTVWFEPVPPPLLAASTAAAQAAVVVEEKVTAPAGPTGARVASYVALGLGAAALGAGLLVGAAANADAGRAADKALTVREAQDAAAASNGKATVANVLFVAGGVAALTGGVVFLFSMPEPGMRSAR